MKRYGHSSVETFYRILEGIPVNSLKKDLLRKVMTVCVICGEDELYDFLLKYFKMPSGDLTSDEFKVVKLGEEIESTKILLNTPFVPQNDGTWVLSGKDLATFGGLKGLFAKGFRKQPGVTFGGDRKIVGPDGSEFTVKIIKNPPTPKIILKQINENNLEYDKICDFFDDDHATDNFVLNTMINPREIISAYIQANGDLDKTLEILKNNNVSWLKTEEDLGKEKTTKLIKRIIEKISYYLDNDEGEIDSLEYNYGVNVGN